MVKKDQICNGHHGTILSQIRHLLVSGRQLLHFFPCFLTLVMMTLFTKVGQFLPVRALQGAFQIFQEVVLTTPMLVSRFLQLNRIDLTLETLFFMHNSCHSKNFFEFELKLQLTIFFFF